MMQLDHISARLRECLLLLVSLGLTAPLAAAAPTSMADMVVRALNFRPNVPMIVVQPPEFWAIRNMSRSCAPDDSTCVWSFEIDTTQPATAASTAAAAATSDSNNSNVDANHSSSFSSSGEQSSSLSDAGASDTAVVWSSIAGRSNLQEHHHRHHRHRARHSHGHAAAAFQRRRENGVTATADISAREEEDNTTVTSCLHLVSRMADGTPASRATSTSVTRCGKYGVTSGYGGDEDGDGFGGFTVLSVVDRARGVLVYPAYEDERVRDNGVVVNPDRVYPVEMIPA